jgi:hypothetical protein
LVLARSFMLVLAVLSARARMVLRIASHTTRDNGKTGWYGPLLPLDPFCTVAIPTGFEPVAYSLGNCRSILLSYGTLECLYQKSDRDCTLLAAYRAFFAGIAGWLLAGGITLAAPAPLACAPEGALRTEIAGYDADGVFTIAEGYRLRLANIVWPDHLEPGQRRQLSDQLDAAMKDQEILWKPAAGPDRWGVTPAHLFLKEKGGTLPPFWLQGGLVEAGLVPGWPEPADSACWTRLKEHESLAIRARKGYWAPRAQTTRHRTLEADRESHAGRRLVALWRVKSVKAWRSMHFVNFVPSFRGAPSIGLTQKQMTLLREAQENPALWQGKWIVARFLVGTAGLSRLRVETIDHIGPVD